MIITACFGVLSKVFAQGADEGERLNSINSKFEQAKLRGAADGGDFGGFKYQGRALNHLELSLSYSLGVEISGISSGSNSISISLQQGEPMSLEFSFSVANS